MISEYMDESAQK